MDSHALLELLVKFEGDIRDCMSLFVEAFGTSNPSKLWRNKTIPRVGTVGPSHWEYSMHGLGCSVDVKGRGVSFDFDSNGDFIYSSFKFLCYLDDDAWSLDEINSFFMELHAMQKLHVVPGRGVRLAVGHPL